MSTAARTPGLIPQTGIAVPTNNNNKYVSLYVLLAGILSGLLLILSLFLFCKYCRGKSQGTEGVDVPPGGSWVLREPSFSLDLQDNDDAVRDREEAKVRGGSCSSNRSRYTIIESASAPKPGVETPRCDLEEGNMSPRIPTPSRLVDDVKTNIYLHRQKSFQKNDTAPITCFAKPSSEAVECEVAVEIHPGPSLSTSSKNTTAPLLRHASVSSISSCQVESSKGSSWDQGEERETDQLVPWRTSSTDWTKLETSLDYWSQEHSRTPKEDSTKHSKVRYNDTGSLEEVSVDHNVDYFVEDEIMVHIEAEGENIKQQYRRLWQLRATLEEDEDSKKPTESTKRSPSATTTTAASGSPRGVTTPRSGVTKSSTSTGPNATPEDAASAPATAQPTPSSPDQSPDPEAAASHTTSFESNTEPLLDEGTRFPPHLLQLPSYETRRQNYRNILNWRLRKLEARKAKHGGRQASLDDTSFDSMDTVDTEESSTDASRFEQVTTSFESTTDTGNTDSPCEQQVQRLQLQQLRADSGYRSLENPRYPHQLSLSPEPTHPHRIPSLGESFEDVSETEEGLSVDDIDIDGLQTQKQLLLAESEVDEGVAGLRSPPHSLYESASWEGRRKPGGQPTSKKRREFYNMGTRIEYSRDYSVDEKSDALFREFSRCELDSKRQHRLTAYRRLRGPYPYPKLSEPSLSLTEDDITLATVPIIKVAPDEDSSDHV